MKIYIPFILIFLSTGAIAQSAKVIGVVKGKGDSTLPSATVSLQLLPDSNGPKFWLTDAQGRFQIDAAPGRYRLGITAVGYVGYDTTVTLTAASALEMGIFRMNTLNDLLAEVVVQGAAPPVKQKGDTLEYSSSAFKVNPDANAEDMIKKMPGISVDQQGVKAGGEEVRKVTVDGRDFFGDDATATLRNLPAEIVDKIQVFDRLSEQAQLTGFDDGNTTRSINIITKANMRNGQFGRVYAGYGTDSRYSAGGNISFFNGNRRLSLVGLSNNINMQNFATEDLLGATSTGGGGGRGNRGGGGRQPGGGAGRGGSNSGTGRGFGSSGNFLVGQQSGINNTHSFGVNFSDLWGEKLTVSGSYLYNQTKNSADEKLSREFFLEGDSSQFYNEDNISTANNQNHRVNLRLEYKIDSSNTLLVIPSISFQENRSFSSVSGINSLKVKQIISETGNIVTRNLSGFNFNNNILYRHAFAKKGRSFSAGITTGINNRAGENYLSALTRSYTENVNGDDSLQQFSDRNTTGRQLSSQISYTEPVGKSGQLQLQYQPSVSINKADQQTFQFDNAAGKYSLFDSSLSNVSDSRYTTHNTGVSYRLNSKVNRLSFGLSWQQANLTSDQQFPFHASVNRKFSNFLPNAMLNSKLSAKSSVRVSYRTSTSAPDISQLQNVINNNNPLQLSMGNPELDQQYSHQFMTRYTYTNTAKGLSVMGNLFMQKTSDYIGNATFIANSDSAISSTVTLYQGSQLVKPVNLDGFWNVRTFVTLGMPLKWIKSNLNWNAGYSYAKIPGIISGLNNASANQTYNAGAVLASNISEYIDFTLSYSANFSQVKNSIQPQLDNHYFSQQAGAQLNLLSKSGWVFQNELNNQSYRGLSDGFNQNFWLWNMSIGKKFLKEQKGELRLSVFDLLKQNQSINRSVYETYIEDVQTQVLQQYFMLTFTYRLRNFGSR